jgi:hypothetical protein
MQIIKFSFCIVSGIAFNYYDDDDDDYGIHETFGY